jgi:hypothetical protein
MPNVFGKDARTVEEILDVFRIHGDSIRSSYRARYLWDRTSESPYTKSTLERPPALRENPPDTIFPWEQIFLAAATCAGSDYPMFAAHDGIALDSVELVVEGTFDPRYEFDGVGDFRAPEDARHSYLSLRLRATLTSSAPREALEALHARVIEKNMVLDALRGIPRSSELTIIPRATRPS